MGHIPMIDKYEDYPGRVFDKNCASCRAEIAQEIKEELDGMACTFDPYNNEIIINLTMDKWQSFWNKRKAQTD